MSLRNAYSQEWYRHADLQFVKGCHSSLSCDVSTCGIRASDDDSVSDGECVPWTSGRNIYIKLLEFVVLSGDEVYLQVAPDEAAEASIVGLFQLWMVSSTPSSSSPRVVKPVTLRPLITDFPVEGSMMPGKMAPPWQLQRLR